MIQFTKLKEKVSFFQAFEDFCLPTKKYADVIIPRGAENNVAIELIVQHIQEILRTPPSTARSASGECNTAKSGRAGTMEEDTNGIAAPKVVQAGVNKWWRKPLEFCIIL